MHSETDRAKDLAICSQTAADLIRNLEGLIRTAQRTADERTVLKAQDWLHTVAKLHERMEAARGDQ